MTDLQVLQAARWHDVFKRFVYVNKRSQNLHAIAWPPASLLTAFSRAAHPNYFTLDTALPLVLSNTHSKYEVD